jgi:hypothetical protein
MVTMVMVPILPPVSVFCHRRVVASCSVHPVTRVGNPRLLSCLHGLRRDQLTEIRENN